MQRNVTDVLSSSVNVWSGASIFRSACFTRALPINRPGVASLLTCTCSA